MNKIQKHLRFTGGFTLIELLIVIGILGVLAATLLLTLNPAEAQKRTRDTQRLKDINTLQAIVEQLINSGTNITGCLTNAAATACSSAVTAMAGVKTQNCQAANNFLRMNVCDYAKQVPLDPNNGVTRTVVSNTTNVNLIMGYQVRIQGTEYEIRSRLEADENRDKVTNDGGEDNDWFEVGSTPPFSLL